MSKSYSLTVVKASVEKIKKNPFLQQLEKEAKKFANKELAEFKKSAKEEKNLLKLKQKMAKKSNSFTQTVQSHEVVLGHLFNQPVIAKILKTKSGLDAKKEYLVKASEEFLAKHSKIVKDYEITSEDILNYVDFFLDKPKRKKASGEKKDKEKKVAKAKSDSPKAGKKGRPKKNKGEGVGGKLASPITEEDEQEFV